MPRLPLDPSEFLYYDPYYLELRERHSNDPVDLLAVPNQTKCIPPVSGRVAKASRQAGKPTEANLTSGAYVTHPESSHEIVAGVVNGLSELLQSHIFQGEGRGSSKDTEVVGGKKSVHDHPIPVAAVDQPAEQTLIDKDRVIKALYEEVDRLKAQLWEAKSSSRPSSGQDQLAELQEKYDVAMGVIDKMNWQTFPIEGVSKPNSS